MLIGKLEGKTPLGILGATEKYNTASRKKVVE
jgi:hypothetical protein